MADKKTKAEELAEGKISSLVLRYSLTTFAALLFSAMYNLVDTLFVSRGVGDAAMGGVAIVFPFMIIQSAIAQTVGGGAASIVSRLLGKKGNARAGAVTLNAMAVFYISAVLVSAIGFAFMNPILSLLGATPDLLPYAREYLTIVLVGNVFSTGFSSIIRAEGKMTYALLIWLIPTAVNIVLDAVFIFALDMGVRGAALATVLCQCTSFVMSLVFFKRLSCQSFVGARLTGKTVKEIVGIGLPTLVQMGSLSVVTLLINNCLGNVGDSVGITAFAYIGKIITFAIIPFTAVSQALSPVAGFNHGAGNDTRVNKAVRFSFKVCLIYAAFACLVGAWIPDRLLSVFTDSAAVIAFGAQALQIISFSVLFAPFSMLGGTAFQAIGKKSAALIMYALNLLFLIPILFFMQQHFGVNGIWWAYLISNVLAAFVSIGIGIASKHKGTKC